MGFDFSRFVLRPILELSALGSPVVFVPRRSRGIDIGDPARGVFSNRPVEVATEEGYVSTTVTTLGVRLADFEVAPAQGDEVIVGETGYLVHDVKPDGQGGAELVLKRSRLSP